MISLGTLALVTLIVAIPTTLGYLAGHIHGRNAAKSKDKKVKK